MPSTGLPRRARSVIAAASPCSRSQARSATVARLPGSTTRSAAATSAGEAVQRTVTPGSAPRASTSVELEVRGSRIAATDSRSAPAGSPPSRAVRGGQRVLGVQPQVRQPGQHPEHRASGQGGEHVQAGCQQPVVAAELVDHEAGDQRLVALAEQCEGAVQRGEQATPVDVADHHGGQVALVGQPHVGQVGLAQVDLGGAAGALADHHVVAPAQLVEAGQHLLAQGGFELPVVQRAGLGVGPAVQQDVRAPVAARLEQHRVHQHAGLDAAGLGLQGLGAADLAAVGGHRGVVGHVLGLERRYRHAPAGQQPAQARGEQALAGVGAGTGDQQRALHVRRFRRRTSCMCRAASNTANVAYCTRWLSVVARTMSSGCGGGPAPRIGRCSVWLR